MQARDLASTAETFNAFMALAVKTGLINQGGGWLGEDVRDEQRRFGAEDVAHVLRSALRGFNPLEEEPELNALSGRRASQHAIRFLVGGG